MKKLLFSALVMAAAITGCDCKHGYGPDNCKDTWASNYVGTWNANIDCGGNISTGVGSITEESATSIRIDGDIFANLTDWNKFTIPTQQVGGATVSGQGGMNENTATGNNGAVISITRSVWFEITAQQNGQSVVCYSNYTR